MLKNRIEPIIITLKNQIDWRLKKNIKGERAVNGGRLGT
jgi:hypothetical protein